MRLLERLQSRFPRAANAVGSRVVLIRKAGTFAGIGFINAAIDFAVFWTAVQAFDMPKVPANVLAWLVAVSASYMMNSFITFAAESGRKLRWRSYGTFVASGVLGMIGNTATLLVVDWMLGAVMANADLRLAIAKIAAIGTSFIVNFSMSHFVVFRRRPEQSESRPRT
jgi:putative flippase GtrA